MMKTMTKIEHKTGCGTARRGCVPECENYNPRFDWVKGDSGSQPKEDPHLIELDPKEKVPASQHCCNIMAVKVDEGQVELVEGHYWMRPSHGQRKNPMPTAWRYCPYCGKQLVKFYAGIDLAKPGSSDKTVKVLLHFKDGVTQVLDIEEIEENHEHKTNSKSST